MKNKDIEKNIRSTLSPAKDKIWNKIEKEIFSETPVALETVTETGNGSVTVRNNRGLIYAICAVFIALIVAAAVIIPKLFDKPLDYSGSFFIDINPSVQITVDAEGKVTEVIPLNEDALVLLQGFDDSYVGKSGEEVALSVWETAYRSGYISPVKKNNAVLVTGSLTNESLNSEWGEKIKSYLMSEIKSKGVYCAVLTDTLNNSVQTGANAYGISASKYQLILSALNMGVEISETEYKDITVTEINERITDYGKKLIIFGGKDNHKELESIKEIAENQIECLNDYIEDAVDEIRDYIDSDFSIMDPNRADIERELNKLEDILDEIEDRAEDGRDTKDLFDRLYQSLDKLSGYGLVGARVESLKVLVDDVISQFKALFDKVIDTHGQIKDKYDQYILNAEQTIRDHIKSDNFDDDYEDWLEEVYEDYRENWETRKSEWERDFD